MRFNCFPFSEPGKMTDRCMFCFHHAGGSASYYRDWIKSARGIEIVPCELPGNGSRMGEEYVYDMKTAARDLSREICRYAAGRDIYLFGHSMGAALAFMVCHELETVHGVRPRLLIVAGRHAPQIVHEDNYRSDMGYDELEKELRRLGGTPEEVFENKEIRDFLLEKVRKSYRFNESFRYSGEMIRTDVVAHCGTEDTDATEELMAAWGKVTSGNFKLKSFGGGHFFPLDMQNAYLEELLAEIKIKKAS